MLTLTILLTMVAVPLGVSIAWAVVLLVAGAQAAPRWAPARLDRPFVPVRSRRR